MTTTGASDPSAPASGHASRPFDYAGQVVLVCTLGITILAATRDLPGVIVPGGVTLPPSDSEDAGKVQTIGARYVHGDISLEDAAAAYARSLETDGEEVADVLAADAMATPSMLAKFKMSSLLL